MDTDFDYKFMSDDEVKQMLESILDGVQEEVAADEDETTILDPLKLMQIKFVYSVLKYLTRGTDAEVSYKLYQPFKSMGSVSVEAKVLEFDDPEWFARAAEFASNTEVYPLAKNKVRLTFTFHGLTKPVE